VLALQGDFREHRQLLRTLGVEAALVRTPAELDAVDALILPGGESTTIARLARSSGLWEPLGARLAAGMPAWGTCAGAILLAREVPGLDREPLGAMSMRARRNAFGRQIDSFEELVVIDGVEGPAHSAVFIRAPVFEALGPAVEVLARLSDGRVVAVREGALLATAFHPELTADSRLHALFLDLARSTLASTARALASAPEVAGAAG
jgi:5'-phosphate synthase pdxT subunit